MSERERKSPGSATNTAEANQQKQRNQITTEIVGTVTAGVLFAVVMLTAIVGMSGGFTSDVALVVAEVATDGR